jgi:hypothetical protein
MPDLLLSPRDWAEKTFAGVELGDPRRSSRLLAVAAAMMRRPAASLPSQLRGRAPTTAAYRLLAQPKLTHALLLTPHLQQTRAAATKHAVVLLVQDTTQLDYTNHPATTGLGPIGDNKGRGFLLQTVLAIAAGPQQLLGIAQQEVFTRQPAPEVESRTARVKRARESQAWCRAVEAIGTPPAGTTWVHVGDRFSDFYEFMVAATNAGSQFLIRAAQDRRVQLPDSSAAHLLQYARSLALVESRELSVAARDDQPARRARIGVSWGALELQAPVRGVERIPLQAWIVRVAEYEVPPKVGEGLEWVLISSLPCENAAQAWERVDWYKQRWLIEEYHRCLKSGCNIERRNLRDGAGLQRLLGICAPIAVRLLQIRELARQEPELLASNKLGPELVAVIAELAGLDATKLSLGRCWEAMAELGGYQRRKGRQPGWQTLWQGWQYVQTILEGVNLAQRLPP